MHRSFLHLVARVTTTSVPLQAQRSRLLEAGETGARTQRAPAASAAERKIQVDRSFARWWKENGIMILIGLLAGVIGST